MTVSDREERARALRNTIRKYRRLGYAVVERPEAEQLPEFLRALSPDLLAVRDDDHVVLQIRRGSELKGSNELVETAAAIDQHPGWRFELIALGPPRNDVAVPARATLDQLVGRAMHLHQSGLPDAALVYILAVLEELIRAVGAQHGIRGKQVAASAIVRDLAFRGILTDEIVDVFDQAWAIREGIMHGAGGGPNSAEPKLEPLIEACRQVRGAIELQAA